MNSLTAALTWYGLPRAAWSQNTPLCAPGTEVKIASQDFAGLCTEPRPSTGLNKNAMFVTHGETFYNLCLPEHITLMFTRNSNMLLPPCTPIGRKLIIPTEYEYESKRNEALANVRSDTISY